MKNIFKLPKWLQKSDIQLPEWATAVEDHPSVLAGKLAIVIEVDTDAAIKEWLPLLGCDKPDQYYLECAYQCMKMDLQLAIAGTKYDGHQSGKSHQFNFKRASQWALTRFPPGKGIQAASQGREARDHYKRIRGRLP